MVEGYQIIVVNRHSFGEQLLSSYQRAAKSSNLFVILPSHANQKAPPGLVGRGGAGKRLWAAGLEQAGDVAVVVDVDVLGRGDLGQARHGQNATGQRDHKVGAGGNLELTYRDAEALGGT